MGLHESVSMVACCAHLAFAFLAWQRRAQSRVAVPLAVLFLDVFGWTFADLARDLSGLSEWHMLDRLFSSLSPALALKLVLVFVGRARALRWLALSGYVLFGAIAVVGVTSTGPTWGGLLLSTGVLAIACAVGLLAAHRRSARDPAERARSSLLIVALVTVTVFSSTDLWHGETHYPIPRLGNIATLVGMALFAVAALRLRLLGQEFPPALVLYALALGIVGVVGTLAAMRWLDQGVAFFLLALLSAALVGLAAVRELGRVRAITRERQQRLVTLGRYSQQLAHDLKNPLAALKGALQFLAIERREGRSIDGQAEYLSLMLEQVERLDRVIDLHRRLAAVAPARTPGSVNEVVRKVSALQRFAAVPGVTLRVHVDETLPPCAIDSDLLATALENLLANACEASTQGGVIEIRTEPLSESPEQGIVALTVADHGCGMDPRQLERAKDEFFTTKAEGTGLGLSFAEQVAKAHGGSLTLTSEPGRGTMVQLTLACQADASAS
jgi:two-component system sensor histidine kinase HydH